MQCSLAFAGWRDAPPSVHRDPGRLGHRAFEQAVEIHRRQQELREAALRDEIRTGRACVGKQHAGADAANDFLELVFGAVAYHEHAGLLELDQVGDVVADFRLHGDRQYDLAQLSTDFGARRVEVQREFRVPLRSGNSRPVRGLVGTILEIDLLQYDFRPDGLLRHGFGLGHVFSVCKMDASSPLRSSSYNSSNPPTWRSPMKTCGTERRPLRVIISARSSASVSISISRKAMPLRSSSARARAQYGHQPAEYMTTSGMQPQLRAADFPAAEPRTRGRFSCRQAASPPRRLNTLLKPSLPSSRAAAPPSMPDSQQVITGFSLCRFSVSALAAKSLSGTCRASTMCPVSNAAASRTSTTSAPWFIMRTASLGASAANS